MSSAAKIGNWRGMEHEPTENVQSYVLPCVFWPRSQLWQPIVEFVDEMSSHPGIWDLLATLVVSTQAKVIVEAGTYRGHAAMVMAEALQTAERPDGHVWTADVVDLRVMDLAKATGHENRVTVWIGRFETMLATIEGPIDLAFIDASEPENARLRLDYANLALERCRPGGLVIVDDCANDDWPWAKVLRARANLYLPCGRGTVILQKPLPI